MRGHGRPPRAARSRPPRRALVAEATGKLHAHGTATCLLMAAGRGAGLGARPAPPRAPRAYISTECIALSPMTADCSGVSGSASSELEQLVAVARVELGVGDAASGTPRRDSRCGRAARRSSRARAGSPRAARCSRAGRPGGGGGPSSTARRRAAATVGTAAGVRISARVRPIDSRSSSSHSSWSSSSSMCSSRYGASAAHTGSSSASARRARGRSPSAARSRG